MVRFACAVSALLLSFGADASNGPDTIAFSCYLIVDHSRSSDIALVFDKSNNTVTRLYSDGERYVLPAVVTSDTVSWVSKPTAFETRYTIDRKSTRLNSSHVKISYA